MLSKQRVGSILSISNHSFVAQWLEQSMALYVASLFFIYLPSIYLPISQCVSFSLRSESSTSEDYGSKVLVSIESFC